MGVVMMPRPKRALLAVADKSGLVEFARGLLDLEIEILATGGTAGRLRDAGLKVVEIADYTGSPEILDGRVKTLHPKVHGGLLARRDLEAHLDELHVHGIGLIDIVAVNLYPFKETIEKPGVTLEEALENIDIGGPTMIRAAAKNFGGVIVITDPADYDGVLADLAEKRDVEPPSRRRLALKAFRHTAYYDSLIAAYLENLSRGGEGGTGDLAFPETLVLGYEKLQQLRYGENPHQEGAFYAEPMAGSATIAGARQLWGKGMSFCNVNDAAAALAAVQEFRAPAAVAVKHANPCGVGVGATLAAAYKRAWEGDPVSIFGGIIAVNRPLNVATAEMIAEIFVDIVVAPSYQEDALEILKAKKGLRILEVGDWIQDAQASTSGGLLPPYDLKRVPGGLLLQEADLITPDRDSWQVVTEKAPTTAELDDLEFAWRVVRHVKSNAIILARDSGTVGIGAGQLNRIVAARIAIEQAGDKARGAVLASDAFMPFPDVVNAAAAASVSCVIQPGGSIRDDKSIAAANEHGIAMVFTGRRHFRH